MPNSQIFRASAIRYWEKRRIFYNLALILPSLVGYSSWAEMSAAVDDIRHLSTPHVMGLFAASAIAANVCYSYGYALEFLFGSDDPSSRWLRYGRVSLLCWGRSLQYCWHSSAHGTLRRWSISA
jgi:hypothetical protein